MNYIKKQTGHNDSSQEKTEASPRRIKSGELFGRHKRVVIEHEGLDYMLQITRQGKLILTK